jgi:crotonobetainyl-CoA:carnitine CoA-transferase CaiB-like acyl-CoA transferase
MGSPQELADPKYGTQEGQLDPQCQNDILAVFYPWAMSRTKEEISQAAAKARASAAPLNTTEDVVKDPHIEARGFFVEIDHPSTGRVKYPGAPFRPMETPWQVRRPAPILGQHNEEIYGELGYSQEDITKLREAGDI